MIKETEKCRKKVLNVAILIETVMLLVSMSLNVYFFRNQKNSVQMTDETEKIPAESSETFRTEWADVVNNAILKMGKEYKYPDDSYVFPEYPEYKSESVRYALVDVDSDGKEELIFQNEYYLGFGGETVWKYDENEHTFTKTLSCFPSVKYYVNGYAVAEEPYNQGFAGDSFWPYTVMRYDEASGLYIEYAEVDAWNKEYSRISDYEKPFPDDIDTDGCGIVYLIRINKEEQILSRSEYISWANSFSNAEIISVYYKPVNMTSLGYDDMK